MLGIVADHDRFFGRKAETVEQVAEETGIGLAMAGVFDGGDQVEGKIAETAPVEAGVDDGPGKDRVGGQHHPQVPGTAQVEDLPGQRQGTDQGSKSGQAVGTVTLQPTVEEIGFDFQSLPKDREKQLLVAVEPVCPGQQDQHGFPEGGTDGITTGDIGEVTGQALDVGGDEVVHLHIQESSVQIEKHRFDGGPLSVLPKKLQRHPSGEVLSAAAPVVPEPVVFRSGIFQGRACSLPGPSEPDPLYSTVYPIVPDQPATTTNCPPRKSLIWLCTSLK